MTDYEYALRVVTVSGQEFEIAHAVAPGTLVALCGTVAVPQPGSRWADAADDARCEACERSMPEPEPEAAPELEPEPEAEPEPEPAPRPEPKPGETPPAVAPLPTPVPAITPESPGEPVPAPVLVPTTAEGNADRPALADPARALAGRLLSRWRQLGRGVRIAIVTALLVVVVLIVVVLSAGGGFHADPSSPAYKNGYSYGHDLMGPSNDVASSCAQANIDDPANASGKNFIAGCEAGYAARTP